MGWFARCVDELVAAYGSLDLFPHGRRRRGPHPGFSPQRGKEPTTSPPRHVRHNGLHYLFGLKGNQRAPEVEAVRVLGDLRTPAAVTIDTFGSTRRVERRFYLTEQMTGFGWDHFRTVLRLESRCYEHGKLKAWEDGCFVSRLPMSRLKPQQWQRLTRSLWGVENAVHCTADKMMREEEHPWIEANPKGALIVALLRRIAYNLLASFRAVTLRADASHRVPWKTLLR